MDTGFSIRTCANAIKVEHIPIRSIGTRCRRGRGIHQLIRALGSGGESAAAALVAKLCSKAEVARELAYRLYTLCERAGWAEDARAYNEIVTSWSAIESAAAAAPVLKQASLFA